MRILLIEDETHTADFVARALRESGHQVEVAGTGRDGLFLATTELFDLLILDRMLPVVDGLTILRTLRASQIRTPALVLSALAEVDQRVEGLKAGADDYLVKPFALIELLARVEALLRRPASDGRNAEDTILRVADLELDRLRRSVRRGGERIDLKPREFQLLEYLMSHAGRVVTRTMLLEGVWDYHFDPKTNVIDVHVSNLRSKIDKGSAPPLIHTVRGVGYRLSEDDG